ERRVPRAARAYRLRKRGCGGEIAFLGLRGGDERERLSAPIAVLDGARGRQRLRGLAGLRERGDDVGERGVAPQLVGDRLSKAQTLVDPAFTYLDDGNLTERLRLCALIGNGAGDRERLREDAGARRAAGTGLRLRQPACSHE